MPTTAAGHRAAVVDIADNGGPSGFVAFHQRSCLRECCPPIGCHRHTIHLHQRLQLSIPILSVTAIGDIETFDDSRLRRTFASVRCGGQCKASVVGHSLRPTTSVQYEGDKVVSCGRKAAERLAMMGRAVSVSQSLSGLRSSQSQPHGCY